MLERHNSSSGHLLQRQNSVSKFSKHSALLRQKSRSVMKQKTTFSLFKQNNNDSFNGNVSTPVCRGGNSNQDRIKHLLLKHSKIGFIESFANLSLSPIIRKLSASNDLVCSPLLDDNFEFDAAFADKIIEKEEFDLGRVLGSGGFGSVYEGVFRNQKAAIKVMHKFTKNPAAQIESFRSEFHVMRFNHPNIVKTLAATHIDKFDEGAWVVMEYVGTSNLCNLLNDHEEIFESSRCLKFSLQIASALSYAHKNRIAHLDLKPANILIDQDGNCKVGDFGCSQKVEIDIGVISPTNRSNLTGTFAYRAPELLKGEAPTFKADIYSLGITMWQLKSREYPFSNQNQHVVIFGVVANGLRPRDPNPSETNPFDLSYKDLYRQCWHGCPIDRPSAHELVKVLSVWKEFL